MAIYNSKHGHFLSGASKTNLHPLERAQRAIVEVEAQSLREQLETFHPFFFPTNLLHKPATHERVASKIKDAFYERDQVRYLA